MVTLGQIFHKNPLYKSHCIFVVGPQEGFFFFKNAWRPERLLPFSWQSKVSDREVFQGAISCIPLNFLLLFSGYVFKKVIGYLAMTNFSVYIFWQLLDFKIRNFWQSACLQHLYFGDQHVYTICVLATHLICHKFGFLNA